MKGGYYCEENNTLLVLNEHKVAYIDNGTESTEVNYKVMYGTQLILSYPEGKEIWNYTHLKFTDSENNVYRRLKDAKVTFINGKETTTEMVNVDNRYRVERPKDPTKEGDTFLGWYLGNDTEYKFDGVITKSITLYAKWRDGDGHEYLAVSEDSTPINLEPVIAITLSVIVLAGLVIGYIILVKRRKRNDKA